MSYPRNPTLVDKIERHFLRLGEVWGERRRVLRVEISFEDGERIEIIPRWRRRKLRGSTDRESGDSFSGSTSGSSTGRRGKNGVQSPGPHRTGDS